jgi:indolepyruvate ferredoxin oxidoreductase beta subunit
MKSNLIVCGVGGQGSILSSRIIADAAIAKGYEVRVGETFGAAMRGGSVSSHVKIGDIHSPLIPKNKADIVLSMEPLESLRVSVDYLSPKGIVITNTRPLYPVDVNIGVSTYPSINQIKENLLKLGSEVYLIDALDLAIKAGNQKVASVVLIGALSALNKLPMEKEDLLLAINERVPKKTIDINLKAFDLGYEAMMKQ